MHAEVACAHGPDVLHCSNLSEMHPGTVHGRPTQGVLSSEQENTV